MRLLRAAVPNSGGWRREPPCRLCRMNFYAFDRARSFAIYDEALSEAIRLLKI